MELWHAADLQRYPAVIGRYRLRQCVSIGIHWTAEIFSYYIHLWALWDPANWRIRSTVGPRWAAMTNPVEPTTEIWSTRKPPSWRRASRFPHCINPVRIASQSVRVCESVRRFIDVCGGYRYPFLEDYLSFPESFSVEKLVEHGRYPHRGFFDSMTDEDRQAIDRAISLAGVEHLREREVGSLSGGQKQLVWIAMVLAQETDVLLLDEPTTFLDLHHQLEVMEIVETLGTRATSRSYSSCTTSTSRRGMPTGWSRSRMGRSTVRMGASKGSPVT